MMSNSCKLRSEVHVALTAANCGFKHRRCCVSSISRFPVLQRRAVCCISVRVYRFVYVQVIFLIGNKCDLEAQRDVTYEEAKQFAEENGVQGFFRF